MNLEEIPQDLKYAAIQRTLDLMKAQFARHEELANRIKQMEENYKKEIYELLGSKAAEYSKFYEKRNEVASTMRPKFTLTPEGEKMEREFKKTRAAETEEFFKNLGINVNDIKSIRKKYSEEFGSLTEKFIKFEKKSDEDKTKSNPEGL